MRSDAEAGDGGAGGGGRVTEYDNDILSHGRDMSI